MTRLSFIFFSIWFLMLPFSRFGINYFSVAGLAFDKFIAPVLILIWLALLLIGKYKLEKNKILLLLYVFAFFVIRNISFMDNVTIFYELIWRDMILFGYFALPVLFIDTLKKVDIAGKLISFNAVVACVSAFLVAFSIIELPYDRFSESRIGFSDIKKSIGLVGSYGDVTQLAAFFLFFGLTIPGKMFSVYKKRQKYIRLIVLLVIVMGLIGNQSRSYLLSLIFAYVVVSFFSYRSKRSVNSLLIDIFAILSIIVILPFMLFMIDEIIYSLAHMGGREALGSASARLDQFNMAIALFRENPLFGVGSEFYLGDPYFAHGVHNFWLGQLVKGGGVTVLVFALVMINILRMTIGLFKNNNTVGYAKTLVGYLTAVFVTMLFYPADTDIFWALLGMCVSIIFTLNSSMIKASDDDATPNSEVRSLPPRTTNRVILKKSR